MEQTTVLRYLPTMDMIADALNQMGICCQACRMGSDENICWGSYLLWAKGA